MFAFPPPSREYLQLISKTFGIDEEWRQECENIHGLNVRLLLLGRKHAKESMNKTTSRWTPHQMINVITDSVEASNTDHPALLIAPVVPALDTDDVSGEALEQRYYYQTARWRFASPSVASDIYIKHKAKMNEFIERVYMGQYMWNVAENAVPNIISAGGDFAIKPLLPLPVNGNQQVIKLDVTTTTCAYEKAEFAGLSGTDMIDRMLETCKNEQMLYLFNLICPLFDMSKLPNTFLNVILNNKYIINLKSSLHLADKSPSAKLFTHRLPISLKFSKLYPLMGAW
jgi:hypothetical protein